MKRCCLFFCLLSMGSLQLHAQRELANPLVNSKEAIATGVALHDEHKYKAAIAEYLKVSPSDTSYSSVLHELILTYYNDSNFVEAERYANIGLKLYPHNNTEWYGLLADIYDDTKRSDLALKAYDTILKQNPYAHLMFFNKGITLYRMQRYDEAAANFQRCIIINPYYTSAHYFLGQLALLKGNLVPAMMSFATNLLITPGNRYQKNAVSYMASISEVNTTITDYLKKYKPGKEDDFDEVQEILISKIALDKKYKLKAELEDQIVRQLQVIIEKLEYNANDKGFWMQYYVPMFKKLWDNGHFEPLVFNMFSEVDVKKIKEYNKKEKKKIEAFSVAASSYLNEIRESQELSFNKRQTAKPNYYIKDYLVTGKGVYSKNAKNELVVTGPWEFYYTNGRLKSQGAFDGEGNNIGEWKFYYENGILKETSSYSNGKANGKTTVWNDNGLLYQKTTYVDDKIEGEQTTYFYNGRLRSVENYKDGKKEGQAKYYNVDGYLRTVTLYANDLQEGEEKVYYANGKTESVVKYVKNLAEGAYKEYYDNGQLKVGGEFVAGEKTGIWNSYFKDGKTELIENYTKGKLNGETTSFYANGKVESKRTYIKGEIDGKKEDFATDGIIFSESIFEKGRLRDIKFFDKKGTVISNTTSRKGNADILFYGPDGQKLKQGYYSKEGVAEGKFLYYYNNGNISVETFYKNGLQEGKRISYYANQKINEEGTYKADKADGYFVTYYNNGQVSEEGWYVDGERQGTFINYDLLGKIISKNYYLNDQIHGISEYYTPSGKLDNKQYFDNAWFNSIEQFDSTGNNILVSSALDKGVGKVRFNHFNGKNYFESNYNYYKLNGSYTVNNGDGTKKSLNYYKNGAIDSAYIAWHPNGKIQTEGKYSNGKKVGTWKYYYYDGKLYETENYVDGHLDGLDIQYDEEGLIDSEGTYKDGELEGAFKFFSDNNQLAVVFYYTEGILKGYSYEDKTGKLVPMIPLSREAGTVDSYFKNGVKSVHIVFNEGVADGDRIFYSVNGKEQLVGTRINGLDNGPRKTYYSNGKIKTEGNYYYGEKHGVFKHLSETGALLSETNYYLGNLNGECKYYVPGKPAQTYVYHYGLLELKK